MAHGKDRLRRLAELVSEGRVKATREALPPLSLDEWPEEVLTEASFKVLVSEMYKWTNEAWRSEIRFLTDRAGDLAAKTAAVRKFTGLIVDLRTAQEHTDNPTAQRRRDRWFKETAGSTTPTSAEEWSVCGAALWAECIRAMRELVGAAKAVAADKMASDSWARVVQTARAVDPRAQRAVVAGDLGLSLSRGQQQHLDRQIQWAWGERQRALTAYDDVALELTRVVERALIGWSLGMLPYHYGDILDRVDAGPGAPALGALRLAHAFVELLDYSSEEDFLEQFARLWSVIQQGEAP